MVLIKGNMMKKILSLLVVSCGTFISYLQADMVTVLNDTTHPIQLAWPKGKGLGASRMATINPRTSAQIEIPSDIPGKKITIPFPGGGFRVR